MKKFTTVASMLGLVLMLLPSLLMAQSNRANLDKASKRAEVAIYNNFIYQTNFEENEVEILDPAPGQSGSILKINGIKWHLLNGKIEKDPLRTIPEGKSCISLEAYRAPNSEEGCTSFEMLEDLPVGVNKISFEAVAFGQDGLFALDGWRFEFSLDQGATWAFQKFSMPEKVAALDYIIESTVPTRFRIRYLPDAPQSARKGQKLNIDAMRVTHMDDYNAPARIFFDLYDGYQTSNNYITFTPDFRGEFGMTDPDNPDYWDNMFNSYLEVRVDGNVVQKISAIPEDLVVKVENIAEGDHTLEVELKHVGTEQEWGPEKLIRKINFSVKPFETVKGLAALKTAELGKFYEVTPKSDANTDVIRINLLERYRAQKYLLDEKSGILVDDPRGYSYQHNIIPDKQASVTRMRGRLVEMDHNRIFLLDNKMDEKELDESYQFRNFIFDNFEQIKAQIDNLGLPVFIDLVEFPQELHNIAVNPNASYKILDQKGDEFTVYIAYAGRLYSNQLQALPDHKIKLFAILSKAFSTGEPCLIPVYWVKTTTVGVGEVAKDNGLAAYYSEADKSLHLRAPGKATVLIFDMQGNKLEERVFTDSEMAPFNAPAGAYVVVIKGENASDMFKIVK